MITKYIFGGPYYKPSEIWFHPLLPPPMSSNETAQDYMRRCNNYVFTHIEKYEGDLERAAFRNFRECQLLARCLFALVLVQILVIVFLLW